jgi:hypothetical protein
MDPNANVVECGCGADAIPIQMLTKYLGSVWTRITDLIFCMPMQLGNDKGCLGRIYWCNGIIKFMMQ